MISKEFEIIHKWNMERWSTFGTSALQGERLLQNLMLSYIKLSMQCQKRERTCKTIEYDRFLRFLTKDSTALKQSSPQ